MELLHLYLEYFPQLFHFSLSFFCFLAFKFIGCFEYQIFQSFIFCSYFFFLKKLKLDKNLISLKNFHIYDPLRGSSSLILDGQTLVNLEIFENTVDGTDEGTLFKLINRCDTGMGSY